MQTLRRLDAGRFGRHLHWRAVGPIAFAQAAAAHSLEIKFVLRLFLSGAWRKEEILDLQIL